jgi:hypothetical protein
MRMSVEEATRLNRAIEMWARSRRFASVARRRA